jgi:hypothetical protein
MQNKFTLNDNKMYDTVTTRVQSEAFILLDSADRPDGQPLNNFQLAVGRIISPGYFTRLALVTLDFQLAIPNVNPMNNTLVLSNGLSNVTITVPVGFYNTAEMESQLNTSLNTWGLGGTFTVTRDAKTLYFIITNSTTPFKIVPGSPGTDLSAMLGLDINTTLALTQNGGYNNMMYTRYIDITSKCLTAFQKVQDTGSDFGSTNIIIRAYISGPNGIPRTDANMGWTRTTFLSFDLVNPKWMNWVNSGQMISNIDFQLYDENSRLLYLPPGYPDFTMNFLVSET